MARPDSSAFNNPFVGGINNLADISIGHDPLWQGGTHTFNY
jgi:hypothetical protein